MSEEPAKKRRLCDELIRNNLKTKDAIDNIQKYWANCKKHENFAEVYLDKIDVQVVQYPFPVCIVNNLFWDTNLLSSVAEELKNVEFYPKDNDLYHFTQTDDVKTLTSLTCVNRIYNSMCSEFREWLSLVFPQYNLNKEIAATFSSYSFKDRLLCHDDKCENRHIAFVVYLTPEWTADDGGLLQLFNTDCNLYPSRVMHSIVPNFNSIVLFEVTQTSFHQVSEVLAQNKSRLSLNGWYHSDDKVQVSSCPVLTLPGMEENMAEFNLEEYFLFNYLVFQNQLDIKSMFVNDSEIQLEGFLVPNFWESVSRDFQNPAIIWTEVGPPNIRKYEMACSDSLPGSLRLLKEILESKCWLKYLKTITGVDLAPSASSDPTVWYSGQVPKVNVELRRWTRGCYTLAHDKDPEFHSRALDAMIRFPYPAPEEGVEIPDEDSPESGHVVYIDSESKDDECLLHIGYKMNSLALIFRDTKTLRFTKYLDVTAQPFYEVACTYRPWCAPVDQPNLRHCNEETDSEPEYETDEDDSS